MLTLENLLERISYLERRLQELEAENASLRRENSALKAENADLKARLSQTSRNSSRPPSSDGLKKTTSQRKPAGRKPGGQPGHKGHTLELKEHADRTVKHLPADCACCGASLNEAAEAEAGERRQVFDLPPDLRLQVVEHRTPTLVCPRCQAANRSPFPAEVRARAQYGPRLAGLALSLHHAQAVSIAGLTGLLRELLGGSLCGGTLVNLTRRLARAQEPRRAERQAALAASPLSHADETGLRVAGRTLWAHVWCDENTVELRLDERRGAAALARLENYEGTLVHDGWISYRKLAKCRHALCNAHHLRELAFLHEVRDQAWAAALADLLRGSLRQVDAAKAAGLEALDGASVKAIRERGAELLREGRAAQPPPQDPPERRRGRPPKSKELNLIDRLERHAEDVWRFLTDFRVPFDNNLAERAIRMLKVLQKMKGGWRTLWGAEAHLAIRSSFMTAKAEGLTALQTLQQGYASRYAI